MRQDKINTLGNLEYLKYHSFLNSVSKEFEKSANGSSNKMQKYMLALTIGIIDAFSEIYGDHDLKEASGPVTKMLVNMPISHN